MEKFAERLYELRTDAGLSQAKLAKAIGVSNASVCSWERGRKEPMAFAIIALAEFFDVTTDYLLGLED